MVQPVESLEFPTFEKSMAAQWQAIKALFMSSNENIKDATRELIDVSFRHSSSCFYAAAVKSPAFKAERFLQPAHPL